MKATIKGDILFVEVPLRKEKTASKSGKTIVIATSGGNQPTDLEYDGKKVTIGINAYIKPD